MALPKLLLVIAILLLLASGGNAMSRSRQSQLRYNCALVEADWSREEARAAFYHGYRSYMNYGFPADEVRPLSCMGRGSDKLNPYV
jgi:hypothetical protein